MQDVLELMSVHRLNDNMDVIRHNAPRREMISLALEMQESTLDDLSGIGAFVYT